MTWTKLDDNIFQHPKMVRAGEDAANLYVRALVYCNRYLTDGRIEDGVLCAITSRRDAAKLAERLVAVGAWEAHPDGGWMVHNFHEHNPTSEEVEARRAAISAKRSEAGKRGGKRSGEARSNEAKRKQNDAEASKQNEPSDSEATKQNASPVPSRPVQETPAVSSRAPDRQPLRCPTSEPATSPTAADPAEVLAKMRAASDGLVADPNVASAGELIAVKRAVEALISRGVTLDEIVRSAKHLAHDHWTQRRKRTTVTAGRLVEERDGRGSILGELIAESDGCDRCSGRSNRYDDIPPPRPPQIIKIMQGEEIDRALLAAETTGPLASFLRNRKRATVQGG